MDSESKKTNGDMVNLNLIAAFYSQPIAARVLPI
jgi:hypothetical protein